ncbi:MAG: phosphoribosylformylglycinamidine cyclo-ligase [Gammaproteobacteria bacterium]|nr:phosphoribosylformylglycinamidine cyclo-ligase [Gammaproteobacteria bacterium]
MALTAPQKSAPAPLRYRDSGVSIDAGNDLAARIAGIAARTHGPAVLGGIGGFGALYELPAARYKRPVLVSAADGVGTKLKLAAALGRHDTVGVDAVAMCVNDLIACAAEPLFFLDYLAAGQLQVEQAAAVVAGVARGCAAAGCALVGGESAEMPGMYAPGEYDLAGFAVGIVEKSAILDASRVAPGDALLGLASSGPHANGFSLIRKIIDLSDLSDADWSAPPGWAGADSAGATLGDILLAPTRIYVKPLLRLLAEVEVTAVSHITGGGLLENPPRVLPPGAVAEIRRSAWQPPPVFEWLQAAGRIEDKEMLRTFNCGIGLVAAVAARDAGRAADILEAEGETVYPLGRVRAADGDARVEMLDD